MTALAANEGGRRCRWRRRGGGGGRPRCGSGCAVFGFPRIVAGITNAHVRFDALARPFTWSFNHTSIIGLVVATMGAFMAKWQCRRRRGRG
jgi:hypothetical protein